MARSKSRPARWAEATAAARDALDEIETAQAHLEESFSDLRDLQTEYEEWLGNLAEVAQGTTTEEYLQAIVDLDLEPDLDLDVSEIESALDEAEAADLPRGFGRD